MPLGARRPLAATLRAGDKAAHRVLTRMRSNLFVPGSRPELFAKALAGSADALSFDLEDAVPDERKPRARAVAGWLACAAAAGQPSC